MLHIALAANAASHPTLPTMWTATVKEAQVGVVKESYIMVDKPTPDNPSAKWTNYTDGSCQRLIYVGNNYDEARYLLGCDAVDCCTETQSGNHVRPPARNCRCPEAVIATTHTVWQVEYQIPNVHPAFLAPVTDAGNHTITMFDGSTVTATAWQWKFAVAKYTAYTTSSTLHRWTVNVGGDNITNDYVR